MTSVALLCALAGCETEEGVEEAMAREAAMAEGAAGEDATWLHDGHDEAPAPAPGAAAQQMMAALEGPSPGSGDLPEEGDRGRILVKNHNGVMGVPYWVEDGQVWVADDHGIGKCGCHQLLDR